MKPLVGRSPHHVQNNQECLKQLEDIKLGPDHIIMSYDVKALFTSVPIKPAMKIIQKLLEEDLTLPQRTTMTVNNITCLLEFCLTSTYFTFQKKIYEQVEGAAMGSPISPIEANLYMEDFEMRALNTAPQPPLMWKRYVDDTCVIIKAAQQQSFLNHINSIDKKIQFTSEEPRPDGYVYSHRHSCHKFFAYEFQGFYYIYAYFFTHLYIGFIGVHVLDFRE